MPSAAPPPRRPAVLAAALILAAGLPGVMPAAAPRAPRDDFVQPESTRRMINLIHEIRDRTNPLRDLIACSAQVPVLRAMEAQAASPAARLDLKVRLAKQLLQAGREQEALQEYDAIDAFITSTGLPRDAELDNNLLTYRALCHLRIGERANCLLNHNADSCLFPLRGGGIHTLPEGARSAATVLTGLLQRYPGDLRARWLLNIAYMALGEYPEKVPAKWLLDPKLFASDYDIGRFPDVAAAAGLDAEGMAGGVVLEDFDGDGLLDVMVSSWGFRPEDQLRVYRNRGDGTFEERTNQAGLAGMVSGLNLLHCDYNNDGYPDVLVLRGGWMFTEGHYPVSLLRNNGDFTFTDVTEECGLISHRSPTQAAVWFDFNGDGWIDLFIANESLDQDVNPCELYRNNGDGTFTECAVANGVALQGYFKAVACADYDHDGRPDLFLSNRQGRSVLLHNDGPAGADRSPQAPWRFTDVTAAAGLDPVTRSFPAWFFDYDNDGWEDLMICGYTIQNVGDIAADVLGRPHPAAKARLYHNNGNGTFTDVSKAMGVSKLLHTMGNNFGDLDNDGWLDFYCGTGDPDLATLIPSRMFRNDGGRRFQDVTTAGGFGQLQKGHGIAFGDIDNDGDQDIFSVVGGAVESDLYHRQLFANPGHGNHWLKLQLVGVHSNRAAIGARVTVIVADPAGERRICRTVNTGSCFGSGPLRREIGLGQATAVRRVEIFWPVTGRTQVLTGLAPDHAYRVVEDASAAEPLSLPVFTLSTADGASHHHHHHAN
jgi:hypothetical protein